MSSDEPKQTLDRITKQYLDTLRTSGRDGVSELEVRFGTARGMRKITRLEYDAVVKRLVSDGFMITNSQYYLRINSEFVDNRGVTKISRIRAELSGLGNISEYCRTNDIRPFFDRGGVTFMEKSAMKQDDTNIDSYDAPDFNFRVALSNEKDLRSSRLVQGIINSWKDTKKVFRYLSRHQLTHPDLPFTVDVTVVKSSAREGRYPKPTFTFDEARVAYSPESFEIEIEVDNDRVGQVSEFSQPPKLSAALRRGIRLVLSGLQGTNFPVSYSEQQQLLGEYMTILWGKESDGRRVYPSNFVGPSSFTLQVQNIAPINDDANIPNIRDSFTVTDKADGDRKLLMISGTGKIYLIDTNMSVQFTGARTKNEELFGTIMDGEHIGHNKQKKFINLYAAFDIYYMKGEDIRALPFVPSDGVDPKKSRLPLLTVAMDTLNAVGIVGNESPSPMRFEYKTFYVSSNTQSIFQVCGGLMQKVNDGVFEYETDGMIFTPAKLGVGADRPGQEVKPRKKTWSHSFKWKPVEQNTIDFLVTMQKGTDGRDDVKTVFQGGTDLSAASQLTQYKTAVLRVGFDESLHGYVNPCKSIYDDDVPDAGDPDNEDGYKPMQFFPTNPTDDKAGICNLLLQEAPGGDNVIFTKEGEVIEDNMIVEFSYDVSKEHGWRWSPLRVRYDKTADMRSGSKNYGNAYHVANSNWHTIHNPITLDMITTGRDIPDELGDDDVYYNRISNTTNTRSLRDFHNLYIKKKLIRSVSSPGNALIDLAVGKAGDMSKWIDAKLRFVFGVDYSKDNIDNRMDGACARYLNYRKKFKRMPQALFVSGNSSVNVRDTTGVFTDKGKQVTNAVFGRGAKNVAELGKGVYKHYGVGKSGFDVCSVQFAMHYMFQTPQTLNGFLRNVSETTKVGGYFTGTTYDGQKVFNMLKGKKQGESVAIKEGDERIWEITKQYDAGRFEPDSSSLGLEIAVYQESINKTFSEYLVNFDYLDRLMENYGFSTLTREEARAMGLPNGSGSFKEMFGEMRNEMERNPRARNEYGTAANMSTGEQTVSFLNRFFVYKKVNDVDAKQVEASMIGSRRVEEETEETEAEAAKEAAKEVIKKTKKSGKTKKLKKNLVLKE